MENFSAESRPIPHESQSYSVQNTRGFFRAENSAFMRVNGPFSWPVCKSSFYMVCGSAVCGAYQVPLKKLQCRMC